MGSILYHITPLVINSLGGRHTLTHTHTHTHTCTQHTHNTHTTHTQHTHTHTQAYKHSQTEAILRNQVRTWFNNLLYTYTNNTVQLNLNFTHACRHTCVLARLTCAKLKKNCRVHALLHAILVCAREIANTHATQEMHVTSSHLVVHTTRVV